MSEQAPPSRPDPDALLAHAGSGRGRLKVFLGMAPGVGKTFEMLRAARRRKALGGDVVVGVVETHGRRETEALLRGLEVMARAPIEHRARTLLEFDLDAALARRPGLLLVDEYAHSNAPGSRHPKRWQDVQELLAAGIDVWTTLNVQHLESLVDVVWKITGVRQRETVPDQALASADEIELIDITPAELRQRLHEGRVYLPETARLASDRFFRTENLTALRELSLRRAAQTVDDQLVGAMRRAGVDGPWAAGERILVLIGADAMAGSLVRTGRRLSDMMMDAPWTVAHVDRPNRPASPQGQTWLREALRLAEQLGATALVLTADDLVAAIGDHARRNNVTQIVIGHGQDSRWRRLLGRSLASALLARPTGAALHVVTEAASPPQARAPAADRRHDWWNYLGAAGLVALGTALAWSLSAMFEPTDLDMVMLAGVLAAGAMLGLRAALFAGLVAFLAYDFLFLPPRFTLTVGAPRDLLTLCVFLVAALVAGGLAGRLRDQQRATSRRASAITALLAASRSLSAAASKEDAAKALAEQLAAGTGGRAQVLLPAADGEIATSAAAPESMPLAVGDMAAARWAWERGEAAGAGTGTLPKAAWTFHPLQGTKTRSGVAAIEPAGEASAEAERFVAALLEQGAAALERAELAAQAADAEALRRSDRLRSALLNSISHDLRTPLSTVLGATTTLLDYGSGMAQEVRRDLLESIREEAERLSRYVGDLLDMTRIEGGALQTRRDWIDLRDVLNAAAARVERRLGNRQIARDFPERLSLVQADPGLLEQALVNILENAIAYSPDGTLIELAAYEDRGNVVASIEDEGRGIPTVELTRVFERFRRMEEASDRGGGALGKGSGLGLAIAKGFVDAMGGRIAAASPIHDGKGTRILISLRKGAAA